MKLDSPITLPCGVTLTNRLIKSAMSENMASSGFKAGNSFFNVYKRWAESGLAVSISGNVMIDKVHLGEPNNVVIDKSVDNLDSLRHWASASKNTSNQIWVQLNHPGRQAPKFLSKQTVSASAVGFEKPLDSMFATPRALTDAEIRDIITRFGFAAKTVKQCGFQGVQIHGAHGYLVAQFLSEKTNQRTDEWGGSLENRMRFVIEIYKEIRKQVSENFPVSIKINSADFQKGGFSNEEAIQVTKQLSDLGIDLIELSGGSYEKPAMTGVGVKKSTQIREAYFLEYAKAIKPAIKCPLMVTGGFRSSQFMQEALASGTIDLVGLARPLVLEPELPKDLLSDKNVQSKVSPLTTGFKALDKVFPLEIIYYTHQIHRMGKELSPRTGTGVYLAILSMLKDMGTHMFKRVRS